MPLIKPNTILKEVATIISIVPFEIDSFKPGLFPGRFKIEKCTNIKNPILFYLEESKYYLETDPGKGQEGKDRDKIPMRVGPYELADSIINDYLSSQLFVQTSEDENGKVYYPGIFWLPGIITKELLFSEHKEEFQNIIEIQNNWYKILVREADDSWEATRQHKSISNIQRIAAKVLGLDKPWILESPVIIEEEKVELIKCGVCRAQIDKDSIICMHCKCIIKPEEFKKFQFATSA